MNQNRVPPGVPTGGEWTSGVRSEPDLGIGLTPNDCDEFCEQLKGTWRGILNQALIDETVDNITVADRFGHTDETRNTIKDALRSSHSLKAQVDAVVAFRTRATEIRVAAIRPKPPSAASVNRMVRARIAELDQAHPDDGTDRTAGFCSVIEHMQTKVRPSTRQYTITELLDRQTKNVSGVGSDHARGVRQAVSALRAELPPTDHALVATKGVAADEPNANAPTFGQLIADPHVAQDRGFINDRTPAGHFCSVLRVDGQSRLFWFMGELGDPDAKVAGRFEKIGGEYTGCAGGGGGSDASR